MPQYLHPGVYIEEIERGPKPIEKSWAHESQGDRLQDIQWLVLDACIRNWTPKIPKAIAQLVERGFIEEKPSSDGKIFYHVSPRYLSTLQQRPPRNSNAR